MTTHEERPWNRSRGCRLASAAACAWASSLLHLALHGGHLHAGLVPGVALVLALALALLPRAATSRAVFGTALVLAHVVTASAWALAPGVGSHHGAPAAGGWVGLAVAHAVVAAFGVALLLGTSAGHRRSGQTYSRRSATASRVVSSAAIDLP